VNNVQIASHNLRSKLCQKNETKHIGQHKSWFQEQLLKKIT